MGRQAVHSSCFRLLHKCVTRRWKMLIVVYHECTITWNGWKVCFYFMKAWRRVLFVLQAFSSLDLLLLAPHWVAVLRGTQSYLMFIPFHRCTWNGSSVCSSWFCLSIQAHGRAEGLKFTLLLPQLFIKRAYWNLTHAVRLLPVWSLTRYRFLKSAKKPFSLINSSWVSSDRRLADPAM